jgi:uncharacterized membrane protein YadS
MVPLFVLGFVLMAVMRTAGDAYFSNVTDGAAPLVDEKHWRWLLAEANGAAAWCLAVAMTAVGLGTALNKLTKVGLKPLVVGFVAAFSVGGVSFALIKLLAPWM